MIQICRAEDGHIFQSNASLRDIERIGNLEVFLQQETGVEADAVLAYLSDGRRLTSLNVRELAGSQDQSIFVFNKYYLDFDLEEVLRRLAVEASLQPPIEESIAATPPFRPSQLATSYLRAAHTHHEQINHLAISVQYQLEAARIASRSLDMNVLSILDTFEGLASGSRKELARQASLLAGLEADLEIISRVSIHTEFVSPAVRKAIEAGDKHRTLGDYVSNIKMKQVAETCTRTHDDLQARFDEMEQAVSRLRDGSDAVRVTLTSTESLDGAEAGLHRARNIFDRLTDAANSLESYPNPDSDGILQELKQLDSNLRDELRYMVDVKNNLTRQSITALRHISTLNNDMVQIPPALAALQASFRGKNSFSHIQRLHNMLYAYGATVVEIVRRKEFARFFYQRAQNILDVMSKLSSSERKRRQVYRSEVHGQLPFETRGMDVDPVPTLDFSSSMGDESETAYSLERADVDGLLRVLDDLEELSRTSNDGAALSAVRECRASLEKLVVKMDSLESGFDRIAERSLLSSSRISHSRRRSYEADEHMYQEVLDRLRNTEDAKAHQEVHFQEERVGLRGEIHRLQADIREVNADSACERDRADRLERELHQVRAQLDSESTARRILEDQLDDRSTDMEQQRVELEKALGDVTDQTRISEVLRSELAQVQAEFADVKALEERNSNRMKALLDEQEANLRRLEESRERGDNMEEQIRMARKESEDVKLALKDASEDKERLLRAQASEHDRIMRDHIAEADGDRAVLERQFFEVKMQKDHAERQLRDARSQLDVAHADSIGLKEELQRVEHELRQANHAEKVLREDLKSGRSSQSDFEQRLEYSSRLIAQILDVALAFRSSHVKALATAQAITLSAHPGSSRMHAQSTSMVESAFSPVLRQSIIGSGAPVDEPSPIDPSDPAAALEVLRTFDHDTFQDAIVKTGSTVRKWQKQCKEYRERAKGKISFRNFAKGDLALFLPTRNSVSKPWAAFNVSFPHYFLQATGHLAEQLKTREWIVARITSITERVVDRDDPSSNPYALGDGVKYYMLEVEDWTQPSHNKRKVSKKHASDPEPKPSLASSTPALPPGPLEPEIEDTFQVAPTPSSIPFSSRARSNSSPNARPSSLSRLLAQASPELPTTDVPPQPFPTTEDRSPSPTSSPPPPPSPQLPIATSPQQLVGPQSPLRPGSRASRLSTTSRFSGGRIPPLGSASSGSSLNKATATTALSDHRLVSSPSSAGASPAQNPTALPSPGGSPSDMSNTLNKHFRTRTSSYQSARPTSLHIPRASPLATTDSSATSNPSAAERASSSYWNLFRRKKADTANLSTTFETSASGSIRPSASAASDLLKNHLR